MRVDVVTLFPSLFEEPLRVGLMARAATAGLITVGIHDLRPYGIGRHRSVDDEPYGGGAGMVMRPEPLFEAVGALRRPGSHVVLLSPRGHLLNHERVEGLAAAEHVILVCGRYEGVDERVSEHLADEEVSIGDYVLAGGELPALVVIEAVTRLLPGALGNVRSLDSESHAGGLLEYPQYTRPAEYRGHRVPEVLLSGDHAAVARWRREQSRRLTGARRPDLLRDDP
jgi:tRNA (guanine37-N1)-methyltransferase